LNVSGKVKASAAHAQNRLAVFRGVGEKNPLAASAWGFFRLMKKR
jgi:hypothetical protein